MIRTDERGPPDPGNESARPGWGDPGRARGASTGELDGNIMTHLRDRAILRIAAFCAARGTWSRKLSRAVDRIIERRERDVSP